MDGTSNFVGTPLHLIISLIHENEYKCYSLAEKKLPHTKFGEVGIIEIEYSNNNVIIDVIDSTKKIKMDFWEIEKEEFDKVIDKTI
ncbi:MAG TPA: hypothetical protein VFF33_13435 [Ignavibacteriaceae bacterium]|nr:hypothetical protein [Ignavibacteriaceae bacterium]